MSLKRAVDPFTLLLTAVDWLGTARNLVWLARQVRRALDSRGALLFAMRLIRRSYVPRLSLREIGTLRFNLSNGLYLRLATKYDPSVWYEWDHIFPWYFDWGEP